MGNPFYRPLTTLTCMIPIGTKIKWLQPNALENGKFIEMEGVVDAYMTTTIYTPETMEIEFKYRVATEFTLRTGEQAGMFMYLTADTEIEIVNG